jgi:spore germination protein YaaH
MRHSWNHRFGIICLGAIIMLGLVMPHHQAVTAQEGSTETSWCVSVWYPSSEDPTGYDSLMANLNVIDEVNPFWYRANLDGTLFQPYAGESIEKLAAWREAGLKILPAISSFHVSTMIETPELREKHIAEIVTLAETMDYDGIDIDYESFKLETREAFSLFIENLAAALHQNNRLLSVTVHPKTSDVSEWEAATAQDWPRLAQAADIFRIMAYDYHNQTAGPIAPLPWVDEVLAYAQSVTDLQKVRLGLPFYGYTWRRGNVISVVTWATVQNWRESFKLDYERDPADMEANFVLAVPGLPRQTVYIADAESLDFKLQSLLERYPDLGGVAIWGLGGEDPANWSVLAQADKPCSFP